MHDERGKPEGMTVFVRDITTRNQVEQALRQSEQKYREFIYSQERMLPPEIADALPAYSVLVRQASELSDSQEFKDALKGRLSRFIRLVAHIKGADACRQGSSLGYIRHINYRFLRDIRDSNRKGLVY